MRKSYPSKVFNFETLAHFTTFLLATVNWQLLTIPCISADFRLLQEVFDKVRQFYPKNLEHLYVVRFSVTHEDASGFRDCDPYRC